SVDYDFYVFGPNFTCNNFTDPVRCSTTNPSEASLNYNTTGLRGSENDASEGPGSDGNSYVSSLPVQAGETYYLLIDRPHGGGGFELEWTGTAQFLPGPEVQQPPGIEICPSDTLVEVDLTSREAQITQDAGVQFDYFNSFANAFDFEAGLNAPEQYSFTGGRENIYVRVTNPNGCFEIVDFTLTPLVFNNPQNLAQVVCDTDRDGLGTYDLPGIISDIEGTLDNPTEFYISLHRTDDDAILGSNRLILAPYSTSENSIYARVGSVQLAGCFTTFPVALVLEENPYAEVIDLVQCDVDETDSLDGITRINLEQAFPNSQDTTVSFYETIPARETNSAIVDPSSYTNQTAFSQVVYYRIVSGTCISDGELHLVVDPTIVSLNTSSPFLVCDDTLDDGILQGTFDLEEIRQNSYSGLEVAFYANLDDVTLEQNRLTGNYSTQTTTIYARLEASNQCQGVEELTLVVNPLPEINLEEFYQVCTDGEPLLLAAPEGFDSYTWYFGNAATLQEISSATLLEIGEPGNFRLEVGTLYEQNGQSIMCTTVRDFIVTPSSAATFTDIQITEFSADNAVEISVSGDGDYEYSVDGETYQDEPLFRDIAAGFYTIFVRDKNGCGISQEDISIIGYPKFFTPNSDGKNDTWQIIGIDDTQNIVTSVRIYDRYGKLVRVLSADDARWDGMYNGAPLPSSDYWFSIALEGRK
ncbi:T9SS type B sorting domain-containing protein, partial [Maribacter sp.]|nr:T9SS type B sorting domain-containing protein [Maribacter sp.]